MIRIWAIEIPSLTHYDMMVDIEKMVLAGPCNPKFSLSISLFVVNTHTRIKTSLFWHIYGSNTFFFKIVDNVTLKKKPLQQELLAAIMDFNRFIAE